MRAILYIVILLALLMVPAERSDVGNLLPVEVISISKDAQGVEIKTDAGNIGVGESLEAAYQNLNESASADIYMDTADYLILLGEARELAGQLPEYLKSDVRVCMGEGEMEITEVASYLATHEPQTRLKDTIGGVELQVLTQTQTGLNLD